MKGRKGHKRTSLRTAVAMMSYSDNHRIKKPKNNYMERKNMLNIFNNKRRGNIPYGGETYFANAKNILERLNLIQTSH